MVFSSLIFIFIFLAAVLALVLVLPPRCRNGILLIANVLFYAFGEPVYILLMAASIVINYLFGRFVGGAKTKRAKKLLTAAAVAVDIILLGVYKYAGFVTGGLHAIFEAVPVLELALPIGISFYTFQELSYVVDVYRGDVEPERSFISFAAYISLFPQLIAGPIVRYSDIDAELRVYKKDAAEISDGVRIFIIGLGKKVLIANEIGMLWETVSGSPESAGTIGAWMGVAAYSLQLYFDFSGYSDMARGIGRLIGFNFPENFNYPYISKSLSEFWRRWHITLSSWFRDYVYIPLGGNRRGIVRTCVNLLITWALTGLWHGAGWNFILWGLYYGVMLVLERLFLGKLLKKLPSVLQRIYALFFIMLGWTLFASDSLGDAVNYLRVMFSMTSGAVTGGYLSWVPLIVIAVIAATPAPKMLWDRLKNRRFAPMAEAILCGAAFLLCTGSLVSQSYNPFLYFRF